MWVKNLSAKVLHAGGRGRGGMSVSAVCGPRWKGLCGAKSFLTAMRASTPTCTVKGFCAVPQVALKFFPPALHFQICSFPFAFSSTTSHVAAGAQGQCCVLGWCSWPVVLHLQTPGMLLWGASRGKQMLLLWDLPLSFPPSATVSCPLLCDLCFS